jgi:hypothetical protein
MRMRGERGAAEMARPSTNRAHTLDMCPGAVNSDTSCQTVIALSPWRANQVADGWRQMCSYQRGCQRRR